MSIDYFVILFHFSNIFSRFSFQLTFKCSGSSQPPPSQVDSHVDPHTGVQLQEVTATISKDLVYEYFGKSPFKCECHAWSPRGKAKSQAATIEVACKFDKNRIHFKSIFIWNASECATALMPCIRPRRWKTHAVSSKHIILCTPFYHWIAFRFFCCLLRVSRLERRQQQN